ncbi:proline-rich protein 18 [Puntigrus tetrazona]|uniref:proline-rich protein 18 n=1 Tax=Puntigrus tetrazona TaxID=1606681 RepID=UPI001C894B87|nr:proline-rich protein 18 [Puntigrus tetrazona]
MLGALEIAVSPKHAKDQVSFLSRYTSKTEFLSYLLLYLVKMPFPPVTRPRSLPSSGKEKLTGPSPIIPVKAAEEKSSVKERLKKLSKKATPHKSKLPTSRAPSGMRMECKSTWITTSRPAAPPGSSTPTTSGNSTSTTNLATSSSVKCSSKKMFPVSVSSTNIPTNSSSGSGHGLNSESNFSLNLTPEATLLLQKRSREKQLRAVRSTVTAPHQKDRLSVKLSSRSHIPLKISLLNDRHRYDDVEYEENEQSVDQSVLLKCSEWLRGVENAAGATTLGRVDKISQKSI